MENVFLSVITIFSISLPWSPVAKPLLFNNTGCNCNLVGWNGDPCVSSGKCTCKNGYTGAKCNSCSSGFYRLSSNQECKGI